MYQHQLPQQSRVLVLGGGIHGTGVLHDLASRGWRDIHLLEKATLAHGTSSKSTKLIHGGLRYLERIHDFSLVREALHERALLLKIAPDLVRPLEIIFPLARKSLWNSVKIKIGLSLYDLLAGNEGIAPHQPVSRAYLQQKVAALDSGKIHRAFSFWDAQTDDLGLVRRVAASAVALGAKITEGCQAVALRPSEPGWVVQVKNPRGELCEITARYVVNCLGPWSNLLLTSSGLRPRYHGIANKGIHVLLPDLGLQAGVLMQAADGRICFLLPWMGHTLLGTTEATFTGDPDGIPVLAEEVRYLLNIANTYLRIPLQENAIESQFAGLRWLPASPSNNLSTISREHVIGEQVASAGLLFTLYGGKLTTYRSLAKIIGDRIIRHAGERVPSQTHLPASWVEADAAEQSIPSIFSRFGHLPL